MTTVSAIIPMYNASRLIRRCLAPLQAMLTRGELLEIIVADDCSTDDSAAIVRAIPEIKLVRTAQRGGPGAARNVAAQIATGGYLWFVDADVIVAEDAARVIRREMRERPCAALMGSYDDEPGAHNFLSQYKNLVHHYYHQRGRDTASTFWAGCGVVERDSFVRVSGFDVDRYPYPSIEDIDLGYRIRDRGGQIRLVRDLQGKHLKDWRFVNLIHTEVFRRAMPWTRLMLERGGLTDDLNVSTSERLRALLALVTAASLLAAVPTLISWIVPAALLVVTALANADFLGFFARKRGPWFAMRAFLFHQLYYLYSSAAFAAATASHWLQSRGRKPQRT